MTLRRFTTTASILVLVKLAVAIVSVAAVVAVSAGTASAFSVTNNGCPGSIQVPSTNGYNAGAPVYEFPQRFTWRSPCYSSSTQVISVRYRLWGYVRGTGWVERVAVTRSATVAQGFAGAWMSGLHAYSPNASISAGVNVEWRLTNGTLIGSQYVNYDAIGDYLCFHVLRCGVFADSEMGAFIQFVTGY